MALKLDAAKWRRSARHGARCSTALGADEGLTRYVGGAVRDDLLGLPVSDVDLATRLEPDEVIDRLEKARIKAVPTGIEHGTITAVSDGHPFEITTLAPRRLDRRPPRDRRLHRRLAGGRGAARLHHQRLVRRSR